MHQVSYARHVKSSCYVPASLSSSNSNILTFFFPAVQKWPNRKSLWKSYLLYFFSIFSWLQSYKLIQMAKCSFRKGFWEGYLHIVQLCIYKVFTGNWFLVYVNAFYMLTGSNTLKHTQPHTLQKGMPYSNWSYRKKSKCKNSKMFQQERNSKLKADLMLYNKQSRHSNSDIIVLCAWGIKRK